MFVNMAKRKELLGAPTYMFQDQDPVYLFSNENIAGYLRGFGDLSGQRVLTVCGAGDHAFEAYLAGASYVDTFDINSLQKCVFELKSHMIRNLEYEKFMNFFFGKRDFFNKQIINPIQHKFSDDLHNFLRLYDKIGRHAFRNFGTHHASYDVFKVSYLNQPAMYYALQDRLPERISFQRCRLDQIAYRFAHWYNDVVPDKLCGKYDLILLSNIFDYVCLESQTDEDRMDAFYSRYLSHMSKNILSKDNGMICFRYLWDCDVNAWGRFMRGIPQILSGTSMSLGHKFHLRPVKSVVRGKEHDAVIIMRQKLR